MLPSLSVKIMETVLHIILYAILPIIAVMLAGFISGRKGFFCASDARMLNRIVLNLALPSALFVSIARASRSELCSHLNLALAAVIGIMGCFMAVYYIFKYGFRGNNGADASISSLISGSPAIGFLGFAVLEPIFSEQAGMTAVGIVVATVSIVVNAIGIPVGLMLINRSLAKSNSGGVPVSVWTPVLKALKQPVAWAPLLAVLWVVAGIPWPDAFSPTLDLIAKANSPLAVFSVGITLSSIRMKIGFQSCLGTAMKLLIMPAVVWCVGILCGLEPTTLRMLVIASALPPAFTGIMIADEYNRYVTTGTTTLFLSVILFPPICLLLLLL